MAHKIRKKYLFNIAIMFVLGSFHFLSGMEVNQAGLDRELISCITAKNPTGVSDALKRGANPRVIHKGYPAIVTAIFTESPPVVNTFLACLSEEDKDAILGTIQTDPEKRTPLHFVAESYTASALEIAQILINAGADPRTKDESGSKPIFCAILSRNKDLESFLKLQEAKLEEEKKRKKKIMKQKSKT